MLASPDLQLIPATNSQEDWCITGVGHLIGKDSFLQGLGFFQGFLPETTASGAAEDTRGSQVLTEEHSLHG